MVCGIVDGGHRAIKYSRLAGVKKDIYSEGMIFEPLDIWIRDIL